MVAFVQLDHPVVVYSSISCFYDIFNSKKKIVAAEPETCLLLVCVGPRLNLTILWLVVPHAFYLDDLSIHHEDHEGTAECEDK